MKVKYFVCFFPQNPNIVDMCGVEGKRRLCDLTSRVRAQLSPQDIYAVRCSIAQIS